MQCDEQDCRVKLNMSIAKSGKSVLLAFTSIKSSIEIYADTLYAHKISAILYSIYFQVI